MTTTDPIQTPSDREMTRLRGLLADLRDGMLAAGIPVAHLSYAEVVKRAVAELTAGVKASLAITAENARLREELAEFRANPRDEYHTMAELYDYRMLYNAHAARGWLAAGWPVVKSWRHHDGEECFGGGWFIVAADLPGVGQISNHYRAEDWGLFTVPEVEWAPEWDGHTAAVAADRLRVALGPTPDTGSTREDLRDEHDALRAEVRRIADELDWKTATKDRAVAIWAAQELRAALGSTPPEVSSE